MSLTEEDKQWIRSEMERVESSLRGEVERVETSLLTEFHKWASPVEMRQHSHSAVLRALDMEVETLAERVKKLEDGSDTRSHPEQGS